MVVIFYGSAWKCCPFLWKRMQISSLLIEALANVFGFMEARGIASFGHGNAWTSPIVWNRVDITEHFPDASPLIVLKPSAGRQSVG